MIALEIFKLCSEAVRSGKMELKEAWDHWSEWMENHPEEAHVLKINLRKMDWMANRYNNERGRCLDEAEDDFLTHTLKETYLLEHVVEDMKNRGHVIKWRHSGADNTGKLLLNGERTNDLDFHTSIDDGPFKPTDVKNGPIDRFVTFKVSLIANTLRMPAEQNPLWLVVFGTGFPNKNADGKSVENGKFLGLPEIEGCKWAIMSQDTLRSLWTLEHRPYRGFANNKPAVRIYLTAFQQLVDVYYSGDEDRFTGPSHKYIDFQKHREWKI